MKTSREIKTALSLGTMCIFSYLGCYFSRNLLSVVAPQMLKETSFDVVSIGTLSTVFMATYALGQLINGRIGDIFRAKWLVGIGLFFTGVFNALIPAFDSVIITSVIYGISGIFQSMVYAPLMRVIAENTIPKYASRCSLGFSVASFLGSPVASVVSIIFNWKAAFYVCGATLMFMGVLCYVLFDLFEKKGFIRYNNAINRTKKAKTDVRLLVKRGIVKFTIIAVLTGIVRTSVLFWVPTYLSNYLGFSKEVSSLLYSVITIIKTTSPYVAVIIIYEKFFRRNMSKSLVAMFLSSTICFLLTRLLTSPVLNVLSLTVALFASGCAATMLFSVWCPSLSDTGMVSTATGFVDASSYLGAAIANILFANAIESIGWQKLIIIWAVLMLVGLCAVIPYQKIIKKKTDA